MRQLLQRVCVLPAFFFGNVVLTAFAEETDLLASRAGWEVGGQVATYKYEEPRFALIEGERIGVVAAYTGTGKNGVFTRLDGRVSYGSLDYLGSGTKNDNPDWIAEVRVAVGKDFPLQGDVSLSPYAGLGYRFLFNDLRGQTSTGAIGYRRYSHYVYAPLGLTLRKRFSDEWVIAANAEYDAFLGGRQHSQLSDTGLGFADASNAQKEGYGYRAHLMVETQRWSFGPWVHYWSIKDSLVVPIGGGIVAFEPANWTREYGLELRYRF